MTVLKIETREAFDILRKEFNLPRDIHITRILRAVIDRLMDEDDEIEVQILVEALPSTYHDNTASLQRILRSKLNCIVVAKKKKTFISIRAGYTPKFKSFASIVLANLQKPEIRSVDIKKCDWPKAYLEQPYQFLWRLTAKLVPKRKLRLIDLGDEFRIVKRNFGDKKRDWRCVNPYT